MAQPSWSSYDADCAIYNKYLNSHSFPFSVVVVNFCNSCHVSKSCKLSFPLSSTIITEPLELIVSDLWGSSPVLSRNGYRYYFLLVDVFSKFIWIYPIARKSDAFPLFVTFKTKIENFLNKKIKVFQSDNGNSVIET